MTIRRQPADFVVIERPVAAFLAALRESRGGAAIHAVYELEKESLGTPEAVAGFARAVGVRAGEVDYAGLKDRHARTTQMVSAKVGADEPAREVEGRGFMARLRGWSEVGVTAEAIEGNRFEIVVRDLSAQAASEMGRRARLLEIEGGGLLVVNYFGAQRFGSARHGQGFVAAQLIRGEFEQALRLSIGTPARKDSGKTREFTRMCATHWGEWKKLAEELPRCPERKAIEVLAGHGQDARATEFKAAFEALPYFTQQMSVEAFQSHLWNGAARRLMERMVEGKMVEVGGRIGEGESQISSFKFEKEEGRGRSDVDRHSDSARSGKPEGESQISDFKFEKGQERAMSDVKGREVRGMRMKPVEALRADDEFGVMLFPPAAVVDAGWRGVRMPVLGPKTVLAEPWGWAVSEALAEEGIKQEELRIPGLRRPFFGEAERGLFVVAERFEMTPMEKDEMSGGKRVKRTVRFDLGRGAYATVVLRAMGQ